MSTPRRGPSRPAALIALATLIAFAASTMVAVTAADAHTALLGASPGPDETVGGTIDFVDLAFLDPVAEAEVVVTFNSVPVAGTMASVDGEIIRFELDEALQSPGRYQVAYEMISADGDLTTSGFFFTFALDGPQPQRIDSTSALTSSNNAELTVGGELDDDGPSMIVFAAIMALAALFALAAVFAWRMDASRRQPAGGVDSYDDP